MEIVMNLMNSLLKKKNEQETRSEPKRDWGYCTLVRKIEYHEQQAKAFKELLSILYPNGYEDGRLTDSVSDILFGLSRTLRESLS